MSTEASHKPTHAGSGALAIASAKMYFILCAYGVQLLLPRFFDSKATFGLFASIMNLTAIINNVLVVATIQTVSKFVSEDPLAREQRLRQGIIFQSLVGCILALSVFSSAKWVAYNLLLDPKLTLLLQTVSVVMFCYSLYAATVGYLNGSQSFVKQAGMDFVFSTIRTAGILLAAVLGFGALGSIQGLSLASIAILVFALLTVGVGKAGEFIPWKRWLAFTAPIWLYQIFLNSIMQIDLLVLKRTVAELGIASGLSTALAAEQASNLVGEYRAAQTFAFIPYQLILAVTFIVFPKVSRAASSGDPATATKTIREAIRFSSIVLLAIASPIAGAAGGVMRIAYPDNYLGGTGALTVLSFGMAALALFVILATALSGAGKPTLAAGIAAVAAFIVFFANRILIQQAGIGDHTPVAAATGTTVGTLVALVFAIAVTRGIFDACIPWLSFLRTALAGSVAFFVAHAIAHQTILGALLALSVSGLAYLGVLFISREIKLSELKVLIANARKR
ncbi:MAG: polysaccharide biosynthesis C-terminal domain-containing protein [Myxococcales bacterium]|nr:MAG: polysaccharide biosynthesis C-terminal domain-containing protein [Myxococcales bacterium]